MGVARDKVHGPPSTVIERRGEKAKERAPIVMADGSMRDRHPKIQTVVDRVRYVVYLMATGQWLGLASIAQLKEDWELSTHAVNSVFKTAKEHFELLGAKDQVTAFVQERLKAWVEEGDPKDRVKAAEIYLKTVGALTEKVDVRHEYANMSDDQVTSGAIKQLVQDEKAREMMRAAIAEWDSRFPKLEARVVSVRQLTPAEVLEEKLEEVEN